MFLVLLVVDEAGEVATMTGELTEHIFITFIARQWVHKLYRQKSIYTDLKFSINCNAI